MKRFEPRILAITCALLTLASHTIQAAAPLEVKGALDLYAPLPVQNAGIDSERFRLRNGGLSLASSLDSQIEAFMELSARDVNGELVFTANQGYLSASQVAPNSTVKLGKFYLGVGILNRERQTDWAFTTAPKSHQSFFANSNAIDSGLEYIYRSEKWETTAGITNGYTYGYSTSNDGRKPLAPTHYLHPLYRLGENGQRGHIGLNYLARTAQDGTLTRVSGLDFRYRLSEAPGSTGLVQGEIYHRHVNTPEVPATEELGGYLFVRQDLSDTWAAGIRLDAFTTLSLRNADDEKRDNLDYAFVPVIDHQLSESSNLRLSYSHFRETRQGDSTRVVQLIELQWVAEFGSSSRLDPNQMNGPSPAPN